MNISSSGDRRVATRGLCALRRCLCAVALVASFDTFAVSGGGSEILYQGSSGILPDQAPWSWNYAASNSDSTVGMAAGVTFLDTTASSGMAGYGVLRGDPLDSAAGFRLDFALRIDTETHSNDDRAGFSLIVLDQAARGVELGFWSDRVWAQNAGFTHGETMLVDTHSVQRDYRLTFHGSSYSLLTDGVLPLAGPLRDYAAEASFPASLVYSQPSFIFFGDDTTSARARAELGMMALAPVPEPGEWTLLLAGLATMALAARRRKSASCRAAGAH